MVVKTSDEKIYKKKASKKAYDKRRKRVNLTLTQEEYDRLNKIANGYGFTLSEFMRESAFLILEEKRFLTHTQETLLMSYITTLRAIQNTVVEIHDRVDPETFDILDFIGLRNTISALEKNIISLVEQFVNS